MNVTRTTHNREIIAFLREYGASNIHADPGGKHAKLRFSFRGQERAFPLMMGSREPDSRATKNAITDLKRMLGPPIAPELRKAQKLEDMMDDCTRRQRQ